MPDGGVPSSWAFSTLAAGPAAARIDVPAAAGKVSRVLTSIKADMIDFSGGGIFGPLLQVFDGATLRFSWGMVSDSNAGPPLIVDRATFDDPLVIVGSPATILSVLFTGSKANVSQQLLITGYDI